MKSTRAAPAPAPAVGPPAESPLLVRRHLRFGWWSLLFFLAGGIALEAMHGFKVGFYLNVSQEARRLMWTLSHAHGTLLALVNIAFALTLPRIPELPARQRNAASACLIASSVLLPAGFFLGGLVLYAGDPGLGILLVPAGAVLLLVAVFLIARATAGGKR